MELIGAVSGREVLCNRPSNGIEAIEQFGEQHVHSGALIVYTSQDSVLQIAAHLEQMRPTSCTPCACRFESSCRRSTPWGA